jgi:DNA-binding NarL/FixJ family response regulator
MMRVLIIDDHTMLAELLSTSLQFEPDLDLVGHAATAAEGLTLVGMRRPDVVLMDLGLPDQDGIVTTRKILAAYPEIRVVMLTGSADPKAVSSAAAAGVCAFLPKNGGVRDILLALRTARQGSMMVAPQVIAGMSTDEALQEAPALPRLTPREQEVLEALGRGLDTRRMARHLGITPNTCRGYIKSLLLKLGCHSQLEAVARAHELRLIDSPRAE